MRSTGFTQTTGETKQAITRQHIPADEGKKFKDNLGRAYVYTKLGCIY